MDLVEKYLSEVMGYKIKTKDKKIIDAFIKGAKEGQGDVLWIEGDYLYTPNQSKPSNALAQRGKDGSITTSQSYGNVSQTWINYIKRNS